MESSMKQLTLEEDGMSLMKQGKYADARMHFSKKLSKVKANDPNRLTMQNSVAQCCIEEHKFEEAKGLLEEVLKKQVEIHGEESLFSFEASMKICEVLIYMSKFTEAKGFLEKLLRKAKLVFGEGSVLRLNMLRITSTLYIEMGMYGEATVILEEIVSKQINVVGKYHSDYLKSRVILAQLYSKRHRFSESLKIFDDLLRLQSSMPGADYRKCLKTKMCMAATYIRMRKFGESASLLKEVLKLQIEKLGKEHQDTVHTMGLLAVSNFGLGKREEGVHAFEVFLGKLKFSLSDVDVITCITQSLMDIGDYENSKSVSENILKASIEILGEDHLITLECQNNIAKCLLQLQKTAEAGKIINEVLKKWSYVFFRGATFLKSRKEVEDKVNNVKILEIMISIANSLIKFHRRWEAIMMKDAALRIYSKLDCRGDPIFIKVSLNFAYLCNSCSDYSRAVKLTYELMEMVRITYGLYSPLHTKVLELHCDSLLWLERLGLEWDD